jgi:UDP-N-acetylmuramate--alanine ligase
MKALASQEVTALLASAAQGARVYLVGAGGCGVSCLGHLLLDLNFRISGSDLYANEAVGQLVERGADIQIGHTPEHLIAANPVLVIYSSAVAQDNPQLQAASARQIPIARRAILLAALAHRRSGIAVAGMHGKTTTSALVAFALEQLGEGPSYAIGASVPQFKRHARCSDRRFFVFEADESDGTLREFSPDYAVITNIDEDHLDYFVDLQAICREFQTFANQTRQLVVYCGDDPRLAALYAEHSRAVSYGFGQNAEYRIAWNGGSAFELSRKGRGLGTWAISLLGQKNILNAAGAITLLLEMGFEPSKIAEAVRAFTGASRRQQEIFCDDCFRVFDDYGHHPAEIEATISALRSLAPKRLLVAFQPHRFTRTQHLLEQFGGCFKGADKLWLADIYSAGEPEIDGINSGRLADEIRAHGQTVEYIRSLDELRRAVRAAMLPGDLALFLGAGDITHAAHQLASELRDETMKSKEELFSKLKNRLNEKSAVRRDEPLAKRTTLRVGGPADLYAEPASEKDLAETLRFCAEEKVPFLILGRGSNLLVKDGGVRGLVISLAHPSFGQLRIEGERLHCGAGVKLKTLAVEARRHGLTGLEFLEGIPGSVGGALRMNAGAMGSWMFEVVETIRFMDYSGNVHEQRASEVNVEYRGCPLFKDHVALGAVLKADAASREAIAERMMRFSEKRWETQPAAPSAGCIFKNPLTVPAGKLIDELGLKGTRIGGAVVSDVHGNFIVNDGHATARDVLELIDYIRKRAKAARGIELETEVQIIGE